MSDSDEEKDVQLPPHKVRYNEMPTKVFNIIVKRKTSFRWSSYH